MTPAGKEGQDRENKDSLKQREKCLLNLCVPVLHTTQFKIYSLKNMLTKPKHPIILK